MFKFEELTTVSMKYLSIFAFSFIINWSFAQQLSIPRVDMMPDMPQPYEMRDWKTVARNYDSLVFDLQAEGQFLPLASIFTNTTNYPDHDALAIQTYIGTNSPPGKEAINILPAVIGATLSGIDKSDQNGINWPLYCEEYFNRRPEENVYLNGPTTSTGHDWWYETMPNIFFYQLNFFYSNTGDFEYQVTTLADRWIEAVNAMGGNTKPWEQPYMNYRAFKLATMTPLETGVKQPEAAGAIGWILYQAYNQTGEEKYRIGAEQCLEFLSDWESNPSYEIQLPYGVYAAARMNAELGTTYDVEKMINWCFDRGDLRGWGVITGNWGGNDMDGLIGEVNASAPDYVFHMNSLEHVGALVPAVRYDDRFATAIAKWVLNAANASRFYYAEFLEDEMQDNEDWTSEYDLNSAVAYESLREKTNGPYGTGDAMNGGWAQTNLGLYGSSHIGIFGGIIEKTNIEGILQLDLLATDYYGPISYQTYLYFNPYDETRQVEIEIPGGAGTIYDAISNEIIIESATGIATFDIAAKSSVMVVILPWNSEIVFHLNRAYVNGVIIDYNAGETVENYHPRIKALATEDTLVVAGTTVSFYCTADDREGGQLEYFWGIDDMEFEADEVFSFQLPEETGYLTVHCKITDEGGLSDSASIIVKVVDKINYPPEIEQIVADDRILDLDGSTSVTCFASDPNGDELTYLWSASSGTVSGEGKTIDFNAPGEMADIYLVCEVSDTDGESAMDSILILVRDPGQGQTGELVAHYEFNENANDITGNGHDGTVSNCIYTDDMHGYEKKAIKFNISSSKVTVQNADDLNFQDGLTVSYWININEYFEHESYPVSHGNWTTRWKTSLTEEHIRFTLNGSNGTIDIDSEEKLEKDKWIHVVALFNVLDCLVFIDGELSGFKPYEGKINKTSYNLVFGQSLPDQSGFNYNGAMDKLRIYNYGISYEEVKEIYQSELLTIDNRSLPLNDLKVFPNPSSKGLFIEASTNPFQDVEIAVNSLMGQTIITKKTKADNNGFVRETLNIEILAPGSYFIVLKNKNTRVTSLFIKR